MLKCSFIEGSILHRLKYGKGRGQNLAKAVGMKFNKNRNIINSGNYKNNSSNQSHYFLNF